MLGVACKTEHIVNIVLGKRKSEGCKSYTLRFIYNGNLLLFCGNQSKIEQGELFIQA